MDLTRKSGGVNKAKTLVLPSAFRRFDVNWNESIRSCQTFDETIKMEAVSVFHRSKK